MFEMKKKSTGTLFSVRLIAFLLLSLLLFAGCAEGIDENTTAAISDFFTTSDENSETTTEEPITPLTPEELKNRRGVVISKVYGNGNNLDAPVEYSFIELYNTTDQAIPLDGLALYYTSNTEKPFVAFPFRETSINANSYLLIRCNPAYKSSVKTYDRTNEVLTIDKFDLTWNITLDNNTSRLLLASAGMQFQPDADFLRDSGILSYFVADEEKIFDTNCVDDMTKNKIAVRTELSTDSGYYLVNLTKANKAKLEQIVPQASSGKNTVLRSLLAEVDFSHPAGYYTSEFDLTLTPPDGYGLLYTTDGSDPALYVTDPEKSTALFFPESQTIRMTDTSKSGVGPTWNYIKSNKPKNTDLPGAHVIRACGITFDGEKSATATYTNTYFVNTEIPSYNVTTVSLSMPKEHFWGNPDGFYDKTGNYDLNIPDVRATDGMVEIFDENGTRRGYSIVELAVSGHGSSGQPMHSMKVYFMKKHNQEGGLESKLHYDVFQGSARNDNDQAIGDYSRLLFRSAGNDYYTYMRDGLIQNMCAGLDIDRLAYRQTLLFLNGEFFGVYNIRERYSGEYFESHHSVDKDNVALIESDSNTKRLTTPQDFVVSSGPEDAADDFNELYKYVLSTKLNTKEQYEYALSKIDVDSLIDLLIAHNYFNATDWPRNNVKVWRNVNPDDPSGYDTKWHFVMLDMDWGISYWNSSNGGSDTTETANLLKWADDKSTVMGIIFHYFLKDTTTHGLGKATREEFLRRYYDAIRNLFQPEQLSPILESMVADKSAVFDLLVKRLYVPGGANDHQQTTTWERYNYHVDAMRKFVENRPAYAITHMCTYYGVDETYLRELIGDFPSEAALPPVIDADWDKMRSYIA